MKSQPPIEALEEFDRRQRRAEFYAWLGAFALHLPLLAWQGTNAPLEELAQKPMEISIASEEPSPAMAQAPGELKEPAAAGAKNGAGMRAALAKAVRAKNPFAGFHSGGPWGKGGTASGLAAKAAGAAAGGKEANVPDIPAAWKPKGQDHVQLAGLPAHGQDEAPGAPDKAPSGFSSSPWAAGGGSGGSGGGLAGGGAGDDAKDSLEGQGGARELSSVWPGGGAGSGPKLRGGGGGKAGLGSLFEMRGPMAKRQVVRTTVPAYPDWALEQGIEADVTLYFVVLPDGSVKEPIVVKKTSGDARLDELVMRNLSGWRFSRLNGRKKEEQWGLLTFHFRLRG